MRPVGFRRLKGTIPEETFVFEGVYAVYSETSRNQVILVAPDDDVLELMWDRLATIPLDKAKVHKVVVAKRAVFHEAI